MSRKIVVNRCFGGFSLSKEAYEFLGLEYDGYGYIDPRTNENWKRDDNDLVRAVEKLDKAVNGRCAKLCIVHVPKGVSWHIKEYDGIEYVAENHRTWG